MNLIWTYLKKNKGVLVGIFVLMVINQVFSLLDPQFFRLIVDRFASHPHDFTLHAFIVGLFLLILGYMGVSLVSRVAKNFQDFYTNKVALSLEARIYADSISHALSLPYARFEDERSGSLLDKIKKASQNARELLQTTLGGFIYIVIGLVFVVGYAFWVYYLIGIAYLAMIPIVAVSTFFIGRKIKKIQSEIMIASNELSGNTTETVRNLGLVKSLGLEGQEIGRLQDTNRRILGLEITKQKSIRALSFSQGTLINTLRATIIFLCAYFVWSGVITVGEMFSLFIYSFYLFNPLAELGNMATKYYEATSSFAVLASFLNEPKEVLGGIESIKQITEIQFNNVSFMYPSRTEETIHGVNFTIGAGETIAFVGPSGSGKSTLVKLLTGLYQAGTGSITVNGASLQTLSYESIRKRIGLVMQENDLFAGTIAYNIRFVKADATDDQVVHALDQAQASAIINVPGREGIKTIIGEGGIKLSGGERQRIAIARALVRNPDVLIFDEATSALDTITEREIVDTISHLSTTQKHLAQIIIAHRLSTVVRADRIYVMEKGSIVESGSHTALLEKKGLYYALWREQQGVRE